ncbi:MAG: hypothetical protein KUG78_03560, partial [Kangiellaceae bacterium]|nr:hypothetical protein [Kangiellaceae bacterium]
MVKRTISSIMWLVYWIPEPIYKAMAWLLARIFYWSDNKTARSIYTNLLLCFPGTTKARRKQIALNYLTNNFYMSKEATYAWLGNREFIQSKFTKVDAGPIAELSGKQPIIIAVPHIGNWEFFWHWLQPNFDAISMYSPAKFKPLDQIILKARKQFGGKPFDTSSKGMIRLLKALKNNGIMMILPDQAPRLGA